MVITYIFFALIPFFYLISIVAAHGYIHEVDLAGQSYPGWNPFADPYNNPPPKIVRKVASDGFVARDDPDLPCHHGGREGTQLVGDVAAGSTVTFYWAYWPSEHQGPVSTYMTSCNGDCKTFTTDGAKWFKVDAEGYEGGGQWAADKLRANNNSWVSKIPNELAPGQYLIRNEIIALHSSEPQFYPSCAQINVSGSGSGKPSDQDLVSIPGLYDGVNFPDIYSDFGTFTTPGPAPVTFGQGGGGGSQGGGASPQPTASTTPSVSAPAPTGSSSPSKPSHCLLAPRKLVRRRPEFRR